jgi:hypothetical protein
MAVGIGGCGAASATNTHRPPSSAGVFAGSTTCSSSSSAPGSCTFLMSDGRRFRCPARFARGPENVAAIEHSKACTQLSRRVIPVALRPVAARITSVRACLTAGGEPVVGGLVLQAPSPGDPSPPAGELDTSGALIAFYVSTARAQRSEPSVLRNVKRIGGEVEREGTETVAWVAKPSSALRSLVSRCTAA